VREFASETDHPLADFVAAALITAAENQVREMGALLGHLAQCCRDDVSMRTRVWVARARTRSAVRIIAVVVVVFVLGLIVLDPNYLEPYGTPTGVFVALLVAAMFAGSFAAMKRLGRIENPVRFIARRDVVEA
jgi:Flp pilus assembly protein TadB